MGLQFLADHCVSNAIVESLCENGHAVVRLREHLPVDSSDSEVIALAQKLDVILLSLNGDFADIVTYPPSNFGGIIAIQLRNHPESNPQLMKRLCTFFTNQSDRDFYRGRLLLVEVHRIRLRQ
ncbi:MAG: DUF5615 family PIN-like protein [Planctomycetota bacterium]|nr:DUF5615 family PIN-like protein [Planctomycetota bacterium]MDA1213954.1 DUF5615 family PIN-like protein [Planctomycetota bacterium]